MMFVRLLLSVFVPYYAFTSLAFGHGPSEIQRARIQAKRSKIIREYEEAVAGLRQQINQCGNQACILAAERSLVDLEARKDGQIQQLNGQDFSLYGADHHAMIRTVNDRAIRSLHEVLGELQDRGMIYGYTLRVPEATTQELASLSVVPCESLRLIEIKYSLASGIAIQLRLLLGSNFYGAGPMDNSRLQPFFSQRASYEMDETLHLAELFDFFLDPNLNFTVNATWLQNGHQRVVEFRKLGLAVDKFRRDSSGP